MKIQTNDGKVWPVLWVSSAISSGELWINMESKEKISEVAKSFEESDKIIVEGSAEGRIIYEGYSKLTHIMDDGTLTIRMKKE